MIADDRKTTVSFFDKAVLPWFICGIGMLFYCFNYFLRVSPSVMQNDLMQNLHITAYQFGNLAAFYYYAYTPMQISVGMIYDRFGARFVLFFACLVAITGLATFIMADTLTIASLGRFLIGLGTAFAYVGVLKLALLWLPPNRFAAVAGLTSAFGMSSAIFSNFYLTKFVHLLGYKSALYTALFVGMGLSVAILLFMRNKPQAPGTPKQPTKSLKLIFAELGAIIFLSVVLFIFIKILTPVFILFILFVLFFGQFIDTSKMSTFLRLESLHPVQTPNFNHILKKMFYGLTVTLINQQMILVGVIGCLFYLPASVFLDLWGIPYLKTVYQLSAIQAAFVVNMTFVGWIISGPSIGALSDKIKRRRLPLLICAIMSALLLTTAFYVPGIPLAGLCALFFFVGIFCGAHPLCFALGKENNPHSISGTAVAVTNTLIMVGGAIFQPIVGKLLDWHTSGALQANGTPLYSASDYSYALCVVPLGLLLAVVLSFFLRETYCESYELNLRRREQEAGQLELQPELQS